MFVCVDHHIGRKALVHEPRARGAQRRSAACGSRKQPADGGREPLGGEVARPVHAVQRPRMPATGVETTGVPGRERLEHRDRLALGVRGDEHHVGAGHQRARVVAGAEDQHVAPRAPRPRRAAIRRRRP